MGSRGEGHAVARGAGALSPLADTLKGATSLLSYQESEFYYLAEAASILQQLSDNYHPTKQKNPNSDIKLVALLCMIYFLLFVTMLRKHFLTGVHKPPNR